MIFSHLATESPKVLQSVVREKRVAIVNDVINAGSALRGTFADLQKCGAQLVAIASLVVLGTTSQEFAATHNLVLESIATLPNNLVDSLRMPALCFRRSH